MITKNDLLLLLSEMEAQGVNVDAQLTKAIKTNGTSFEVLKFINDYRPLDVAEFYTMLRKNYNKKKSPLYKNLVKEEFKNPSEVLTTLAALNLQILLYAKKLKDDRMFLKHCRGAEISQVLNTYYTTFDLIPCYKALKVIKADIIAFETITGHRIEKSLN